MNSIKIYSKNTAILFGLLIGAFIVGSIYQWISPYFLNFMFYYWGTEEYPVKDLLPAPIVITISLWFMAIDHVFNKPKIKTAGIAILALSILLGMILTGITFAGSLYRWAIGLF